MLPWPSGTARNGLMLPWPPGTPRNGPRVGVDSRGATAQHGVPYVAWSYMPSMSGSITSMPRCLPVGSAGSTASMVATSCPLPPIRTMHEHGITSPIVTSSSNPWPCRFSGRCHVCGRSIDDLGFHCHHSHTNSMYVTGHHTHFASISRSQPMLPICKSHTHTLLLSSLATSGLS